MARYIDADKLKETLKNLKPGGYASSVLGKITLQIIADTPTADVAEVKHGYNKTSMHPVDEFLCSECGFCCSDYTETKYDEDGDYEYSCECEFNYCPNCGAKMDVSEMEITTEGSKAVQSDGGIQ